MFYTSLKRRCIYFLLIASGIIIRPIKGQEKTTNYSQIPFVSSNLPIVVIQTGGEKIQNEKRIFVDMGIIYNEEGKRNYLSESFNHYDGKINIEIRGSSSTMFPKKQYSFETQDSLGNNLNVSLLGLPSENDWILFAPYSDKTLIRNVLAYNLARAMGHYACRTKFCELVLNNEYWGVYVLMESIKRDKNRVNISKINPDEISGAAVTGGYILKIDKTAGEEVDGWFSTYPPFQGAWQRIFYQYHYPKPAAIVPEQKQYIQQFILNYEGLMSSTGYANPESGYPAVIDIHSFVDFLIINELAKNVDGYRLSSFMYKDRDSADQKLYMGPIWDFNLGFGNADYYNGASHEGWQIEYLTQDHSFKSDDSFQVPFWWKVLWQDSLFQSKIYQRWNSLRNTLISPEYFVQQIDSLAFYLKEAQQRNFQKWPVLDQYVWPNPYIGGSYQNEINHLKAWIAFRIQWMDENLKFDPVQSIRSQNKLPPGQYLISIYPNPSRDFTTISYRLFEKSEIKISIFNLKGQQISRLVDDYQQAGNFTILWDGKNTLFQSVASGIYFCSIEILTNGKFQSQTQKIVFFR